MCWTSLQSHLSLSPRPLRFAVVSGAHLYGFDSPDSDVDLRGMYVLPAREVVGLRLGPETWNCTQVVNGLEVDFVFHDLHKYVRLLMKRSGEVLEQLYSPLVVLDCPERQELQQLFEPLIGPEFYHHYRGFLHRQMKLLEGQQPTLKQLLYAYRVVLTGIHLLRTGRTQANLSHLLTDYPQEGVTELLELKRSQKEQTVLPVDLGQRHRQRLQELELVLKEEYANCTLRPDQRAETQLHEFVVRLRLGA